VSRVYRAAIVGAGIGAQHVEGYQANPGRFEVAVICDLDRARAEALAVKAPGAEVVTDYAQVLARADVDIVDICLPPKLHVPTTIQALEAGKHVVCEKPLAACVAEVDDLMRIAQTTGRKVVPVYQYRFGNGLWKMRRLVEAGLAGRPLVATVETHWNRLPGYYAVPWRGKKATELGGAVLGHAIHAHDLLTTVLGPVRRVSAKVAIRVNAIETEDCAAAVLEMESGALVTLSVTLGSAEEITRLRFCFEHLTAESNLAPYRPGIEPWRFLPRGERSQAEIDSALAGVPPRQEGFAGLFEAMHAALEGQGPWPVTLEEARRSLELATAIYVSSAETQPVELPIGPDHPGYSGWLRWLPG
jgi:predicted dehydrogenase